MTRSSPDQSHSEPALEVDRVEWLSSSTEAVVVRVFGRWREGAQPPAGTRLIVDDGGERRPYPALPGSHSSAAEEEAGIWSVAFSVPIELRPRLEHGLVLELGADELALPPAVAGAALSAPPVSPPAQVIDRAVLAERRARRAELNEQALMRRLADSEARVTTLESQLANLESRLERAGAERAQAAEHAREHERQVRAAKQREYAEQQLRFEAEERARRVQERAQAELQVLRTRLAEAEQQVRRLSEEQERVRRELAEAQHSLESDRARLRRSEEELAARQAAVQRRESSLAAVERDAAEERARAESALTEVRAELQETQRRLEARRDELEARVRELEQSSEARERELATEVQRRRAIADELEVERRQLGAVRDELATERERLQALERERGEDRMHVSDEVGAELELLREELDQARESAREHAQRGAAAQQMLDELGTTLGEVRSHVAELEQRAAAATQAQETVAMLERTLTGERERHERQIAELRAELEQARAAATRRAEREAELERMVADLTASAAELRTAFEQELGALRADLDAQVLAEREGYMRELEAMEQRVEQLRVELGDTVAALHGDLQAEQEARERAERDLAAERQGRQELEAELAAERARAQAPAPAPAPVPEPPAAGDALSEQVDALERELADLRRRAEAAGLAPGPPPAPAPAAPAAPEPPAHPGPAAPAAATAAEMAEALAQAVARLRARTPAEPAADAPLAGPPEAALGGLPLPAAIGVSLTPPVDARPVAPRPAPFGEEAQTRWLGQAIRALALASDEPLARELVLELLPLQGHRVQRPLTYVIEIEGAGRHRVAIHPGHAAAVSAAAGEDPQAAFVVSGTASALAELAAGGMGRRTPDLRLRGRRRRLRPLRRAMHRPVSLGELATAGIRVWPGLLLAALVQEIVPAWTTGHRFVLAVVVQGEAPATLYVTAHSGARVEVRRQPPAEAARATLYAGEGELLRLLAGLPAADTPPQIAGEAAVLDAFLSWVDRLQGRNGG